MALYARKSAGHHVTISTTAPTGLESVLPAWTRCKFCERPLVHEAGQGSTDAQFVYTTSVGPSCPTCDRNPITGVAA